jgi:hypothetical protein
MVRNPWTALITVSGSAPEKIWRLHLNVKKTVQLNIDSTVEANRLREVAALGNVTAKGGRIRSRNFVSISSVA